MRYPLLLLVALTACGGGGTPVQPNPPPPPPPPPAPGPPASITIQAGDNQEAEPGTAVAITPAVLVKDAQGRAVPGAPVTFAVESGGGTVQQGAVTTAADGTASSGNWTLGPAEGANLLTARVAGVASASFHATGKALLRLVGDTIIGAGGGSLVVSTPGDPANGLRVTLPPRSYATATHIVVRVIPTLSLTLPAGVSRVGPALQIDGFPAALADSLLSIRIPVVVPAGASAAAFIRDPVSGRLELLSPAGQDAVSITVVTRHLSPALMLNTTSTPGLRLSGPPGPVQPVQIVVVQALNSRLQQGVSSGFTPGVDDWEFPNAGSYMEPGGQCAGQSIAAMWYYLRLKPTRGPLNHSLDRLSQLWEDNPLGYRFSSVVQTVLDWNSAVNYLTLIGATATGTGVPLDRLNFSALALGMLATGEPQFVSLHQSTANGGHAIVAFGVSATQVFVSDPNFPGETHAIDFQNDAFQPYASKANVDAAGTMYDVIRTVGTTTMISTATLDAIWLEVDNHTIGANFFPANGLQYYDDLTSAWVALPDTLVTRQASIRLRAECPTCFAGIAGSKTEWLRVYDTQGTLVGDGLTVNGVTLALQAGKSTFGMWTQADPDGASWEYLDYQWRTIVSAPFTLEPAGPTIVVDSVLALAARPHGVSPARARYLWDFGDGSAPVQVTGDSVVSHKFDHAGTFVTAVVLRDDATGKDVARAETVVQVGPANLVWVLTSFTGTEPAWSPTAVNTRGAFEDYGAFFALVKLNPASAMLTYRAASGSVPAGASLGMIPAPSIPVKGVGLGSSAPSACEEPRFVQWTGNALSGVLKGLNTWLCVSSAPSIAVAKFEVDAVKTGTTIAGTLTATYRDYSTTVTQGHSTHTGTTKVIVIYQFTGSLKTP